MDSINVMRYAMHEKSNELVSFTSPVGAPDADVSLYLRIYVSDGDAH